MRIRVFGTMGKQRRDRLAKRVQLVKVGDRAAALGAEPIMNAESFLGRGGQRDKRGISHSPDNAQDKDAASSGCGALLSRTLERRWLQGYS